MEDWCCVYFTCCFSSVQKGLLFQYVDAKCKAQADFGAKVIQRSKEVELKQGTVQARACIHTFRDTVPSEAKYRGSPPPSGQTSQGQTALWGLWSCWKGADRGGVGKRAHPGRPGSMTQQTAALCEWLASRAVCTCSGACLPQPTHRGPCLAFQLVWGRVVAACTG